MEPKTPNHMRGFLHAILIGKAMMGATMKTARIDHRPSILSLAEQSGHWNLLEVILKNFFKENVYPQVGHCFESILPFST